eukprot:3934944-Rhodomonas_salina.4
MDICRLNAPLPTSEVRDNHKRMRMQRACATSDVCRLLRVAVRGCMRCARLSTPPDATLACVLDNRSATRRCTRRWGRGTRRA